MTDIINVPLNKLTVWTGNVRKVQNRDGIDALAASIKAHGLQQNLVVRKDGKKFAVVAGGRRLKALQQLAKAGDIPAAFAVPCRIAEAGNETELSLAENVMREDMHPADQFEAFRSLTDDGMPATDIAARFGCSEAHVQKLLKLARVSPAIIRAYRHDDLTLECVMAFTVTDDHEAQAKVLAGFDAGHNDARDIRAALTENDIAATDKRVKFVTLKHYEKAGGKLKRDLFSDDESGVYIEDGALLDTLVTEGLAKKAKPVRAEGWKWVEVMHDFGYQQSAGYRRLYPAPVPLTDAEQYRLDILQAEYAALNDAWSESDERDAPERLDALEQLIAAIEDRDGVWTPEQFAIAGAVVSLDHAGTVKIERGLVKPEDMPKQTKQPKNASAGTTPGAGTADEQPAGLSAALTESLTAHKSVALAATLLDKPDKALAMIVHALAQDIFIQCHNTVLELSGRTQSLQLVEGSTAFQRLEQDREAWGQRLPATHDGLWQWCLEQDQSILLDLLAFCAACMVNAVQRKADSPDCPRLEHARTLSLSVNLDIEGMVQPDRRKLFQPRQQTANPRRPDSRATPAARSRMGKPQEGRTGSTRRARNRRYGLAAGYSPVIPESRKAIHNAGRSRDRRFPFSFIVERPLQRRSPFCHARALSGVNKKTGPGLRSGIGSP
jgi:ParB family chromosome partitioning protein